MGPRDERPPVRVVPDAAALIRERNRRSGRRLAVLDDDPTGSQAVHGVSVVTVPERSRYRAGLAEPGDTCFILTNTRSLDEAAATALNESLASDLHRWAAETGATVELISRGDSTLRGHVIAEIEALAAADRAATGRAVDGVLFCPAMLEAGRYTVDDTHLAVVAGVPTPVALTEFARDPTFGYAHSDLRKFLAERSGGRVVAAEVASLSLRDIRVGGPERVAKILMGLSDARWVIVNATEYADLDVVALGLRAAQDAGQRFLIRSGPSFVRSLAGIAAKPPLTSADLTIDRARGRHGLIVVGSHVGLTTRQVETLRARCDVATIEASVPALLDQDSAADHLASASARAVAALRDRDTLLITSRKLVTTSDPATNLGIARAVSDALVTLVRRVRGTRPAWIITKGGITGHDVAVRALDIRRAVVSGQFLPGQISLLTPVDAPPDVLGCPYVPFPGNVGSDGTLALVRDLLATASGH